MGGAPVNSEGLTPGFSSLHHFQVHLDGNRSPAAKASCPLGQAPGLAAPHPLLILFPFLKSNRGPASAQHSVTHQSRIAYILGILVRVDSKSSQCVEACKEEKLNIKSRAEQLGIQRSFRAAQRHRETGTERPDWKGNGKDWEGRSCSLHRPQNLWALW